MYQKTSDKPLFIKFTSMLYYLSQIQPDPSKSDPTKLLIATCNWTRIPNLINNTLQKSRMTKNEKNQNNMKRIGQHLKRDF